MISELSRSVCRKLISHRTGSASNEYSNAIRGVSIVLASAASAAHYHPVVTSPLPRPDINELPHSFTARYISQFNVSSF